MLADERFRILPTALHEPLSRFEFRVTVFLAWNAAGTLLKTPPQLTGAEILAAKEQATHPGCLNHVSVGQLACVLADVSPGDSDRLSLP